MENKIYQKHSSFINSPEFKRYCTLHKRDKDSIVNFDGLEFTNKTWIGKTIRIIIFLLSLLFFIPNILEGADFIESIIRVVFFFVFVGIFILPLSFVFSEILFYVIIKPIAKLIHKKSKSTRNFNSLKNSLSPKLNELNSDINYYVKSRSKELLQGLRNPVSFEDYKEKKIEFTNSFEFINGLHQFMDIKFYSFIWDAEKIIKYDFDFVKFDKETNRQNNRYLNKNRMINRRQSRYPTEIKTINIEKKLNTQQDKNENQTFILRTKKHSAYDENRHNSLVVHNSFKKSNNSNASLKSQPEKIERKRIFDKIDALRKRLKDTLKDNDILKQEGIKNPTQKNSGNNYVKQKGELNNPINTKPEKTKETETISEIDAPIKTLNDMVQERTKTSTRKSTKINHEKLNERKIEIGRIGEEFVLTVEQEKLIDLNSPYKDSIQHISTMNDSLGYDIISYDANGKKIFIEVKSTTQDKFDDLFFSINELNVMKELNENYQLYRVYNLDLQTRRGKYTIYKGYHKIMDEFEFFNEELRGKFDYNVIN